MSFTIKLAGTPYEFKAEATETILEAGDKAGFLLPSACRSGACGACKAQIISGTVALGPHEPFALTEADQKLGLTLLCRAKATSDCEIKVSDVKLAQKKPEGIQAEIVEKTLLDPCIMRLVLKRADGGVFEFKAGQTYAVELPRKPETLLLRRQLSEPERDRRIPDPQSHQWYVHGHALLRNDPRRR